MPLRVCAVLGLASLCAAGTGCSDVSCNAITPAAGSVCVPSIIQPDQSSAIEVREECGVCSAVPSCDAILRNGAVYLTLSSQICSDVNANCSSQDCPQRVVRCTLPALSAGMYPLIVTGTQNYLLNVQQGGQSSCKLPAVTP
jgi:hypothetical protein